MAETAGGAGKQPQLLVATFPGEQPALHVASLDVDKGRLTFREVDVEHGEGGELFGPERHIALSEVSSVASRDNMVRAAGSKGETLVQLHLETPEEEATWAETLCLAAGAAYGGGTDPGAGSKKRHAVRGVDGHGEGHESLRERSQKLQEKIKSLESLSARRDQQLEKMMGRLEGAMQMLQAMGEMCQQQRAVIVAQRQAIDDLSDECGMDPGGLPALPLPTLPSMPSAPPKAAAAKKPVAVKKTAVPAIPQLPQGMPDLDQLMELTQNMTSLLAEVGLGEETGGSGRGERVAASPSSDSGESSPLGSEQAAAFEQEKEELMRRLNNVRDMAAQLGIDIPEDL